MAATYYKILLFMKRRPGMSMEAFKDYYETRHAPLCLKYGAGMARYTRRFLTPQLNPETGEDGELPFDVITELWFEDEAVFRGTLRHLSTSIMAGEIVEDEKQLFDRPKLRMATVVECESELGKPLHDPAAQTSLSIPEREVCVSLTPRLLR